MCIIGAGPSGLCTAKEIQANNPNIDIKIFEKDHALSRRFQKIDIDEPSVEDTIKILQGLKKNKIACGIFSKSFNTISVIS
jgi:2-polyprenyl-6-methoxyphenol hydroxylase-like FAD-dependent oxidoreductase